jgi:uncharacterized protein (TIGR03083 family)
VDRLGYDRYDAEFEAVTAQLGAAVGACAPDDPLPACPEWTVRDLVTHVGTGHRWAADIVERRLDHPVPQITAAAPQEPEQWPDWLADGALRLRTAVRDGGPDRPVWTWQADKTAGFWLRRMLHDELVHRFDAELAADRVGEVAPDLAGDGVTDLLDCIARLSQPELRALGGFGDLAGDGQTLLFQATDPGLDTREWFVRRTADGVSWRPGPAPADVTVRAPARELLLVLNRRLDPAKAGVQTTGDHALFAHWLEHGRF